MKYLSSSSQDIFDKIFGKDGFKTREKFKHLYLKKVHLFAENFRKKYNIKSMKIIEDLETELGFQIDKIKTTNLLSESEYKNLVELDRRLYDLLLKIKKRFNKYSPINKDIKVMLLIAKTISTLVDNFIIELKMENNKNFIDISKHIKTILDLWIKDHSIHYVINSNEFNLYNDFDSLELNSKKDLIKNQAFFKSPINSNLLPNIGQSKNFIEGSKWNSI